MKKKTAVIFESFQENLRIASWEALTCAIEFSEDGVDEITLVLMDDKPKTKAGELSRQSGYPVIAIDIGNGGLYNSERTLSMLSDLFRNQETTHICLAGTTQGLDYAPGLATRLSKQCMTAVESVVTEEQNLCLARAIYGGKIMEKVRVDASGAVIVTQPGTFKPFSEETSGAEVVECLTIDTPAESIHNVKVKQVQKESSALAEAPVIISAGRGIKEEENLELVQRLAAVFTKSAVGGSRPICDLEWMEYKQQVGITGATVTPDLYLACGISGAAQHISGMRNSGFIVSINIDPKAAIFNYSDVCIVEDLTTFIPTFIETVEKLKPA